jgi:putative inorganic carbon (HCO3(-)) transporter
MSLAQASNIPTSGGSQGAEAITPGLTLYLVFVTSWFLHLPARLEFLGAIRFDLLLVCILAGLAFLRRTGGQSTSEADKTLRVLIVYTLLMTPFVYWPGSALKSGLPNFVKAIVFFYFTIAFVRTEPDLKRFLLVFLACQVLRILEPLYLNLTQDYWGSHASMANWQYLRRLSGAPSDVINPNGLAFVVCTVLPFLYYMGNLSGKLRLTALILLPACLYVLALTGSRTGIVGLLVVMGGIVIKAKSRASFVLAGLAAAAVLAVGFAFLDPDLQDRYLSTFGLGEKNVATAEDRWEGIEAQFGVVWNKPVVGYGLGTSAEANANFTTTGPYAGWALLAHNLYLEIALELGLAGLIIFLVFIKAIFSGFALSRKAVRIYRNPGGFLPNLVEAMEVWLWMNLVFSFASYGLSSYEWYLFGGLSVVLRRLTEPELAGEQDRMRENALLGSTSRSH